MTQVLKWQKQSRRKKKRKKVPIGKLKELSEDKEEQMAILSTFVRLGILI